MAVYLIHAFTIYYYLLARTAVYNGWWFSQGFQLISVTAESMNASEGTQVRFTCQTWFSQDDVTLAISVSPTPPNQINSRENLPDGGVEAAISFAATSSANGTMIRCFAANTTNQDHTEISSPALLLVQGKGLLEAKFI